jgi:hypothetical protein
MGIYPQAEGANSTTLYMSARIYHLTFTDTMRRIFFRFYLFFKSKSDLKFILCLKYPKNEMENGKDTSKTIPPPKHGKLKLKTH